MLKSKSEINAAPAKRQTTTTQINRTDTFAFRTWQQQQQQRAAASRVAAAEEAEAA